MAAFWFTVIGLALDIIGAYFLAIEVIGDDKLRALGERYLPSFRRNAKFPIVLPGQEQNIPPEEMPTIRLSSVGITGCGIAVTLFGGVILAIIVFLLQMIGIDVISVVRGIFASGSIVGNIFLALVLGIAIVFASIFLGTHLYEPMLDIVLIPTAFINLSIRLNDSGKAGVLGFLSPHLWVPISIDFRHYSTVGEIVGLSDICCHDEVEIGIALE